MDSSTSRERREGIEEDLVGELVGDVLASGFFEHVAGSICLSLCQQCLLRKRSNLRRLTIFSLMARFFCASCPIEPPYFFSAASRPEGCQHIWNALR